MAAVESTANRITPAHGYQTYRTRAEQYVKDGFSFGDLIDQGEGLAVYYGHFLPYDRFDADSLLVLLRDRCTSQLADGKPINSLHQAGLARLVCLHDYLAHAPKIGFELKAPESTESAAAGETG
jgi:hypothetical protein